jgi:DNA ligase D-like protein (predicted 3'-phosphoesterase)
MTLEKYWQKRKFEKTLEPKGKVLKTRKNRFVVQEHWATHHHFDFRLEMEGVLKSWAVPKGVPEKKGIKRLAIQTEDHPVDYINFAGKIPQGLYGAGTVKIYDRGKYKLIEKSKNRIIFTLKGKKLKGIYNLIKFKGRKPSTGAKLGAGPVPHRNKVSGAGNQWLLFRAK